MSDNEIPMLTDVVSESPADQEGYAVETGMRVRNTEALIAELQTRIASRTFALTDELMRAAFAEMEAGIYEQISSRLRRELPEIIDSVIREQLTINTEK